MSDRYLDNLLPDFGDYSLENFLDSYRQRTAEGGEAAPSQSAQTAEDIARRSRQIVMQALGETLAQRRSASAPEQDDGLSFPAWEPGSAPDGEPARAQDEEPEEEPEEEADEETDEEPEEAASPGEEDKPRHKIHIGEDGIITLEMELPGQEPAEDAGQPAPEEPLPEAEEAPAREEEPRRARVIRPEEEEDAARPATRRGKVSRPAQEPPASARDRLLAPLVRFIAGRIARRQMQKAEAENWPDPVEYRETEELPPQRAAKFYGQQLRPLRFRCRVCLLLCVTLAWIGLRLPMAGMLGQSMTVQAGVSLVLLLTVMMATLDILAAGVRQLFELRPGAESLATLAALLSCADALMVMAGFSRLQPYCAVGAASLGAALWGEKLDCTARARSMRMAGISKSPAAATLEQNGRDGRFICRSHRTVEGIVRRSEQADFCQSAYAAAAPVLLAASLLLAILATVGGQGAYFLHVLSALLSVSASFTAFLCFPLPYARTARKLQASGAALVGYSGCADIGRARRVVLSDNDLFPPGTMKLSGINILEGALVDKVISYTASLLTASGSGVSGVFTELITRRGYATVQPEEFRCHEGGGLSARINGEQVLVGAAGFMNLMGIRLPQNMTVRNAVCTAISGELVGVFTLEYIPVTSVQESLVTLLQGRTRPIFAIRDFNITPLMLRQLFRISMDNFTFPTFRDRYRIAAAAYTPDSPIAAVLSRGGMAPLVDAAEAGRKLYGICRVGTVISLAGSAAGLLILFLLFRAGSFETATAGNVFSYMFLWSLPVVLLAMGQSR